MESSLLAFLSSHNHRNPTVYDTPIKYLKMYRFPLTRWTDQRTISGWKNTKPVTEQ